MRYKNWYKFTLGLPFFNKKFLLFHKKFYKNFRRLANFLNKINFPCLKIYRQSVYICLSPFVMWLYWIVSPMRLTDAWLVEYYGLRNSSLSTPAGIYLFKVNNRNNRTMCEICSKLTIKISTSLWCLYC